MEGGCLERVKKHTKPQVSQLTHPGNLGRRKIHAVTFDFPDTLLQLEHTAWTEIQAGALTVPTAYAVQQAVTQYAADHGHDRYTVETGLKRAVRHPA